MADETNPNAAPAPAPVEGAPPAGGAGAPAPEGGVGAPGATPEGAPPAPAQPAEEPASKRAARAAQREAKLAAERAALEQQRQSYEQTQKEAAELRERVKRYETLESDPLAFLAHKGLTPQKLLEMASTQAPSDPAALEAKRMAAEAAKQIQEMREQTTQAQRAQQIAQYQGRIQALADGGGERWEFIRSDGVDAQYVLTSAAHYCKANGINPTTSAQENAIFEKVLDQMEAYAEKQLEKKRTLGKYQKKWGQPAQPKPNEPAKPGAKPAAPTLTNRSEVTAPPADPPKKRWSRDQDLLLAKQKWATPNGAAK